MIAVALLSFAFTAAPPLEARDAPKPIPVFVSDNHGDAYFYLMETLSPAVRRHLINFDAHPDSVPCALARTPRRETGAIQCFNWISPLTPRPIGDLTWVPGVSDAETAPYDAASFLKTTGSWLPDGKSRIASLSELAAAQFAAERVVVSVDLDFFDSEETLSRDMESVFAFITELAQVDAVVVAISRPYQPDDERASWLLFLTLRQLLDSPRFGEIRFEVFLSPIPDTSAKARDLRARNLVVPYFDLDAAPTYLVNLLRANAARITVVLD